MGSASGTWRRAPAQSKTSMATTSAGASVKLTASPRAIHLSIASSWRARRHGRQGRPDRHRPQAHRSHLAQGLSPRWCAVLRFATSEIQQVVRWPVPDGVRPGAPPFHESRAHSGGRTESRARKASAQDVWRVRPSDSRPPPLRCRTEASRGRQCVSLRRQRLLSRRADFLVAPVRAAAGSPLIPQQPRASPERKRSERQKAKPTGKA